MIQAFTENYRHLSAILLFLTLGALYPSNTGHLRRNPSLKWWCCWRCVITTSEEQYIQMQALSLTGPCNPKSRNKKQLPTKLRPVSELGVTQPIKYTKYVYMISCPDTGYQYSNTQTPLPIYNILQDCISWQNIKLLKVQTTRKCPHLMWLSVIN